MATILHVGESDHDGYTRFIMLEPVHGKVVVANGEQGLVKVGGHPTSGEERDETRGEAGSVLHLDGQREFHAPGTIESVTFPDGTSWTPAAAG